MGAPGNPPAHPQIRIRSSIQSLHLDVKIPRGVPYSDPDVAGALNRIPPGTLEMLRVDFLGTVEHSLLPVTVAIASFCDTLQTIDLGSGWADEPPMEYTALVP